MKNKISTFLRTRTKKIIKTKINKSTKLQGEKIFNPKIYH